MKNFQTIVLLYIIFYSFISNAFFEDKNIFTDGESKNKSFFNYFSDEKVQRRKEVEDYKQLVGKQDYYYPAKS